MLTVHHLEQSRSFRLVFLLEELGRDYRVIRYARDPKTRLAPPELARLHPLGHAPLLEEDGVIYAETGAIFEHVLDQGDDGLRPAPGSPALDLWRFWMHHAEGSAMPPLVMSLVFSMVPARAPWPIRPIARRIESAARDAYYGREITRLTRFWEDSLAKTGWFAGEFSAADIIMSFPVEAALSRQDSPDALPHLRDYMTRLRARPAWAAARERIDGA